MGTNLKQAIPFLIVTDMEASLKWYIEGLRFKLVNQWVPRGKIEWCWLDRDAVAIMLQQPARNDAPIYSVPQKGAGITISVQCVDALALYREFRGRDVAASEPFVGNGMWVFQVSDPDGYRIEFESDTEVPEETKYSEWLGTFVPGSEKDLLAIYEIINDAAAAYKGIIPADRWHDPYMPEEELRVQIRDGVEFWCFVEAGVILGVMGIQDKGDVTLIRHAYVRTAARNKGIGGKLLSHLRTLTSKPILIGTWADASWAIDFYVKHGFRVVPFEEKERLLRKYWKIPERQVETSVVLADR